MSPLLWLGAILLPLPLITGCGTLIHLDGRPAAEAPPQWTAVAVPEGSAVGWLHDFDDGHLLLPLVAEAIGNNHALQATIARVKQAEAQARVVGAPLFPQAEASISGARSQRLRGSTFDKVTTNQFGASLDVSWQLDLWGRLRDLRQGALAELRASHADYEGARLLLATEVVSSLLNHLEMLQQADVARQTLSSLQTNLAILDARLEAGDVDDRTALEITLSRADIARAEASLAADLRQADAFKRSLEILLGRYPRGTVEGWTQFPQVKREVAAGLPSQLLLRRPDLIAAEQRVLAATHEARASWKALLPDFTLTAAAGTNTTDNFRDLLDPQALVWDLAGRVGQAVFQGGRLDAQVDLSQARREELASQYANTALQAFREVETALAAESFFRDQEGKLQVAANESHLAEELAVSQYERGLVDIITVLESQRRAFDARSTLLRIRNERLQNRLDLYLALGGDFDHPPQLKANS